ncbi:MAG: hypothetical protein R3D70_12265 [Rhizobiaceae bacterium]
MTEIRRAMRSFAVPVTRMSRQDFLGSFNSPISGATGIMRALRD